MKAVLVLLLAFVCMAYAKCAATNVKYRVVPEKVKRLESLSMIVEGDLTCDYGSPGGEIKAVAKYSGITVQTSTAKVCEAYPDFKCPHQSGRFIQTAATPVPSNAPFGKYKVRLTETDAEGNVIYDLDVPYEVIKA